MEGRSSAKTSRLAGIEGIRALAATSVLVYHVYVYGAPDGRAVDLGVFTKIADNLRAGVTLFFVLSGFLLYRAFVASALRGIQMPSVRKYLRNRALRILPAYWVILIVLTLVFHPELVLMPLELLANMLLLQNYVPSYSLGGEQGLGIVPAWSLVIEASFYLLLPLLGYIAVRLAAPRGRGVAAALVPVAAMLAAGIVAKVIARAMDPSGVLTVWNYALPVYADWFAAGMAVAVVRVLHEDDRLAIPRAWFGAGALAAAVLAALSAKLYYQGTLIGNERQTANAILFAFALAFVVLSPPQARVVRWLSLRPLVFLGLASYSLFLVHDPVVRGFREWGLTLSGASGFVANLALIGVVSVLLATASYLYVERPALALQRNWQVGDRAGLGSNAAPDDAESAGSKVTLADALEQALKDFARPEAGSVHVALGGAEDILVRKNVVVSVVAPLVKNAVTYGRISVSVVAQMSPSGLLVAVEDNGRGIDDTFVPFLFQPHARSERSAGEAAGRGLGLSQARKTARENGGDVRYEPNQGGGARFVAVFSDVSERRQAGAQDTGPKSRADRGRAARPWRLAVARLRRPRRDLALRTLDEAPATFG